MPRVTHTKQIPKGPYPTLPAAADSLDIALLAADTTNLEQFAPSGDDLLIAYNTGASPYTITITSVADDKNRTGDITTYSLGASEMMGFRFRKAGWEQSDGRVYFQASNTAVKFAVLQL